MNLPVEATSTAGLVREAIGDSRELLSLEIALAKKELRAELAEARTAVIAFGVAALAASVGLALALMAVVLSTRVEVTLAAILGGVLLVAAGLATALGIRAIPNGVLGRTKKRLEEDVKEIGERDSWDLGGMKRP